ncbi:2OG-Fe(II) oxygenase superfamily domain-containing protein [Phthorimaea operculella]|nr:2OG-Fe(II) oxygenase superfamily domain-containing protein [Phthorimaea operculella]
MSLTELSSLEQYRVQNLCASAYYVRDWVSREEEVALVARVYGAPRPKWTQLSGRRLQNWGGVPHARGMLAEQLPAWLQEQLARLPRDAPPQPNHVLVNEYLPGQGIMPHEDGPLFHPIIATLSLGSHIVLRLYRKTEEGEERIETGALLLEPRSLLILKDELYTDHLHAIEEVKCDILDETISNLDLCSDNYVRGSTIDRETRISLTMRHVPKTTTFKLNFGNKIS